MILNITAFIISREEKEFKKLARPETKAPILMKYKKNWPKACTTSLYLRLV